LRSRAAATRQGLDVAVLENEPSTFTRSTHRNIHHGSLGSNYVVGEQQSKRRVDRAQQAIAEIWFPPRRHRVNVCVSEDVMAKPLASKKANAAAGLLPWRTRACSPPLSCGALCPVLPRYTHPGKRSLRAGPRAPPQAPSSRRSLDDGEPLSTWGAKCRPFCADGRHASNDGVLERISKRISTDHSCRGHDNNVLLASRRNVYLVRSSDRSAWNRRSANSHEPTIFTMQRARMLVPVDPARSA